MRKLTATLLLRYVYTADELFERVSNRDVRGVRSFINYLKKYDPAMLTETLSRCRPNGMTLLSYAMLKNWRTDHYQIAIILLEAGARPHARLTGKFSGQTCIDYAIEERSMLGVRLLLWYQPDEYLNIIEPKTGLTIKELLNKWSEEERFRNRLSHHAAVSIDDRVRHSAMLAQQRFDLLGEAKNYLARGNLEATIKKYLDLNAICECYADTEKVIPYSRFDVDSRLQMISFYQEHGCRYVRAAYEVCEKWLLQFKGDPAALSREQLAHYKNALTCAISLAHQLQKPKLKRHYQRQLQKLPQIELSPSSAPVAEISILSPSRWLSPDAVFAPMPSVAALAAVSFDGEDPQVFALK